MYGAWVQGAGLKHGSMVVGLEPRFTGSSFVLESMVMGLGAVPMWWAHILGLLWGQPGTRDH